MRAEWWAREGGWEGLFPNGLVIDDEELLMPNIDLFSYSEAYR